MILLVVSLLVKLLNLKCKPRSVGLEGCTSFINKAPQRAILHHFVELPKFSIATISKVWALSSKRKGAPPSCPATIGTFAFIPMIAGEKGGAPFFLMERAQPHKFYK